MAGRFFSLFKCFRGKNKKGPGAASGEQLEEPEQIQTLQDDAAVERTQEQQSSRGHFRRTAQMFRKFPHIRRRKTNTAAAEGPAEPDSGLTQLQAEPDVSPDSAGLSQDLDTSGTETWPQALPTSVTEDGVIKNTDNEEIEALKNTGAMPTPPEICASTVDFFQDSAVPYQQQVPAMVKNIHQNLMSHVTVDARLHSDIVRLAEEHPADVALTLLHCAPTCDRAAAMMWRAIGSSRPTMEKVLATLLCVMEDWPVHSTCTSDGDNKDVFALAATLVIWVIVPKCHEAMILHSSRLFVALLFHVVITTQKQMPPEEVENFWRACQEEHRLPSRPSRFAVQAMKALLCRLECDQEVMAMERKCGWDTLLCAHTQHYAVGLLAREMRRVSLSLCSGIALRLLGLLSREEPHWDLPGLAFLVEVLECLDLRECADSILEIMSRHLRNECRQRRRLALRGLVVLSKDPSMARRMGTLSPSLLELLGDADRELVGMTLSVFTNLLKSKDMLVSSTTAPKLAEALLLLFDHVGLE
ncbi:uncharacterized protein LOC135284494 [Passer domesticus]|uniref:uncharacterized protein LOC135284494 n=1 Tax=Passer domesticus TaxID=48849 RepID=UPI0030FF2D1A